MAEEKNKQSAPAPEQFKTMIGGQALIEGILMRGPRKQAVVVRTPEGLVEKVEDYRATEDSMRATLLSAQMMADSIVHEAEAKRDALLSRAEIDPRERIAQIQKETEAVQERLRQGQEELARFIASCREVCAKELHLLEELP